MVFPALATWSWPFTMDDAVISFRYAVRLGDGLGPVWNLADRARPVEGSTSCLYVFGLGALRFLTGLDVVATSKWLGWWRSGRWPADAAGVRRVVPVAVGARGVAASGDALDAGEGLARRLPASRADRHELALGVVWGRRP